MWTKATGPGAESPAQLGKPQVLPERQEGPMISWVSVYAPVLYDN